MEAWLEILQTDVSNRRHNQNTFGFDVISLNRKPLSWPSLIRMSFKVEVELRPLFNGFCFFLLSLDLCSTRCIQTLLLKTCFGES